MHVIVGSKNPVKINAVKEGFMKVFPNQPIKVEGVLVPSNVSKQPMGDEETYLGASNRAEESKKLIPSADFFVGVEGGIIKRNSQYDSFAWIIILSLKGKGESRTASHALCPEVSKLIKEGYELGEVNDLVFKETNSKQKNGSVGILTNNVITRTSYYTPSVILALIPFVNEKLYFSDPNVQ